jgi:hypothetical protein
MSLRPIISIAITLSALLAFSITAYSQTSAAGSAPTWPEVKAIQKEERESLRNKQDSEFRLLLEIQKSTFQSSGGSYVYDQIKLFADERAAAQKTYAQERDRLDERQKEERKMFYPKP